LSSLAIPRATVSALSSICMYRGSRAHIRRYFSATDGRSRTIAGACPRCTPELVVRFSKMSASGEWACQKARARSRSISAGSAVGARVLGDIEVSAAVAAACPKGRDGGVQAHSQGRAAAGESGQPLHTSVGGSDGAELRARDGVHSLGRVHSDCGCFSGIAGYSERDDGIRSAGRQFARAEREIPSAELLSRLRTGDLADGCFEHLVAAGADAGNGGPDDAVGHDTQALGLA